MISPQRVRGWYCVTCLTVNTVGASISIGTYTPESIDHVNAATAVVARNGRTFIGIYNNR